MNTLLLSGQPPGDGGVGEILIKEMLSCGGIPAVSFAGLLDPQHFESTQRPGLTRSWCFTPPAEFARRNGLGLKGTVSSIVDRLWRYEPSAKRLSADVCRFIGRESPDQIWTILDSTVAIDVAACVKNATDIPMLVHVWDDPRDMMIRRKLDRLTRARTMNRFDGLLERAERLGVICEQMAEEYGKRTSAPCIVIRHGLHDSVLPCEEPSSNNEFRIGLSGSMYCHSAWKAFQLALDRLEWNVNGKRIVLVVAGSEIQFRAFKPAECRFYGWRSASELSNLLSSCDVLYVPQPFEPLQVPLARLSFPTKLSTYVATGRPVLLHAPKHGSLTAFAKQHDFGFLSHSLDPVELSEQLWATFSNRNSLRSLSRASARIGSTVLGRDQFERSTQAFLNPEAEDGRRND